jgi:hypothetical protein
MAMQGISLDEKFIILNSFLKKEKDISPYDVELKIKDLFGLDVSAHQTFRNFHDLYANQPIDVMGSHNHLSDILYEKRKTATNYADTKDIEDAYLYSQGYENPTDISKKNICITLDNKFKELGDNHDKFCTKKLLTFVEYAAEAGHNISPEALGNIKAIINSVESVEKKERIKNISNYNGTNFVKIATKVNSILKEGQYDLEKNVELNQKFAKKLSGKDAILTNIGYASPDVGNISESPEFVNGLKVMPEKSEDINQFIKDKIDLEMARGGLGVISFEDRVNVKKNLFSQSLINFVKRRKSQETQDATIVNTAIYSFQEINGIYVPDKQLLSVSNFSINKRIEFTNNFEDHPSTFVIAALMAKQKGIKNPVITPPEYKYLEPEEASKLQAEFILNITREALNAGYALENINISSKYKNFQSLLDNYKVNPEAGQLSEMDVDIQQSQQEESQNIPEDDIEAPALPKEVTSYEHLEATEPECGPPKGHPASLPMHDDYARYGEAFETYIPKDEAIDSSKPMHQTQDHQVIRPSPETAKSRQTRVTKRP